MSVPKLADIISKSYDNRNNMLVRSDPSNSNSEYKNDSTSEYVIAIEDFLAKDETHLSFEKGDKIKLISRFPTGWFSGIFNGKKGLAPLKSVRSTTTSNQLSSSESNFSSQRNISSPKRRGRAATMSSVKEYKRGVALYTYIATSRDELSLSPGDEVIIHSYINRSYDSERWCIGSLINNPHHVAQFPAAYVQIKSDSDDSTKTNYEMGSPSSFKRSQSLKQKIQPPDITKAKITSNMYDDNVNISNSDSVSRKDINHDDPFAIIKQGMIKLQNQFREAFEKLLNKVEDQENERKKFELILKDMSNTVKNDKQVIQRIEHQNRALYKEIKSLKENSLKNTDLLEMIRKIDLQIKKETAQRKKLEAIVNNLETELRRLKDSM